MGDLRKKVADIVWKSPAEYRDLVAASDEFNMCLHLADRILALVAEDRRELVEAYQDYIKVLGEELDGVVGLAVSHGWKSERVEAGERARARISVALAKGGKG